MSSSDFRQIAVRGDRGKSERLFRAAVTAFCSLTRPSRNEIAQLEDLALPLYESVSVEARRFVAAALSEVKNAPVALVRRLAGETVDIAAPLLLRSIALSDVDLIALIGRHGLPHARIIARRPSLNPTISQLVKALQRSELHAVVNDATPKDRPMKPAPIPSPEQSPPMPIAREPGAAAEAVRDTLRTMMRPAAETPEWVRVEFERSPRPGVYARLKGTALTGVGDLFRTSLADALGIDFHQASSIAGRSDFSELLAALKFLDLPEEHAFVIVAAVYPRQFGHAEAIRLFLERFHLVHRDAAADKVRGWREATLAAAMRLQGPASQAAHMPANNPGKPVSFGRALKAS